MRNCPFGKAIGEKGRTLGKPYGIKMRYQEKTRRRTAKKRVPKFSSFLFAISN
jgi:hypothetical protein